MIEEVFFNGYCRVMDQSRIVTVEVDDKAGIEPDCNFGSCPYETTCPIGTEIAKLIKT